MRELAETVVRLTGSKSKIVHTPKRDDDPRHRRPSLRRAQEILQWAPSVPLEAGLAKTIDYFEQQLRRGSGSQLRATPAP